MDALPLQDRRVLVVEDEYFIATCVAERLVADGAQVLGPLGSREDALALIDSGAEIDAAVLDVNLGGEPAFDIADRLAERAVPFLFTSGYHRSEFPERFRDSPMCLKPVAAEAIARAVADL